MDLERYGAGVCEMFPSAEQSKPWDTNVHWRSTTAPEEALEFVLWIVRGNFLPAEGEAIHKEEPFINWLRRWQEILKPSYNTSISAFYDLCPWIDLLKCRNKAVMSNLVVLFGPFVPAFGRRIVGSFGQYFFCMRCTLAGIQWGIFEEKTA